MSTENMDDRMKKVTDKAYEIFSKVNGVNIESLTETEIDEFDKMMDNVIIEMEAILTELDK